MTNTSSMEKALERCKESHDTGSKQIISNRSVEGKVEEGIFNCFEIDLGLEPREILNVEVVDDGVVDVGAFFLFNKKHWTVSEKRI